MFVSVTCVGQLNVSEPQMSGMNSGGQNRPPKGPFDGFAV